MRDYLALLIWICQRQFEICFFEWLQNSVNKLRTLSSTDMRDTAIALSRVLDLGWHDPSKTGEEEIIEWLRGITAGRGIAGLFTRSSTMMRLQPALFTYLRLVLGLLPSGSSFWSSEQHFEDPWAVQEGIRLLESLDAASKPWEYKQKASKYQKSGTEEDGAWIKKTVHEAIQLHSSKVRDTMMPCHGLNKDTNLEVLEAFKETFEFLSGRPWDEWSQESKGNLFSQSFCAWGLWVGYTQRIAKGPPESHSDAQFREA